MCPICEDKRKSYCIRCNFKAYQKVLKRFSRDEQKTLEHFRNLIKCGIEAATRYDRLDSLNIFEDIKESYSIELIEKWAPTILTESPPDKVIFWKALRYTNIRKPSWYAILIRCWESLATLPKHHVLEYDEDGNIADFALDESGWTPLINPLDPYKTDPEGFLLGLETYLTTNSLPSAIGSLRRKHALEYQRIMEMQFDGVDVRSKHGPELGIERKDVKDLKYQMKRIARKLVAKNDPELTEKQKLYDVQRGKKWSIERSTFKNRRIFYGENKKKIKPRTIRNWKVFDGGKSTVRPVRDLLVNQVSVHDSA